MIRYNEEQVAAVTDEEIAELDQPAWCMTVAEFLDRREAKRRRSGDSSDVAALIAA